MTKIIKECGQAGSGISLLMKGACGKEVDIEEAFRCTGCGKWFHLDCIFSHFELEEEASRAHNALKKIKEYSHAVWCDSSHSKVREYCRNVIEKCDKGLLRQEPKFTIFNDADNEAQ